MLHFPFTIIFVAIVMLQNIKSGYLLVEVEEDSPLPPQPEPTKPHPLPTKPQPLPPTPPTLPPPPYTAPPPKPTEAPVLQQEGEPCRPPYGRYGLRTSDPTVYDYDCAAGLECKPRGYSMICVRIEPVTPGYNQRYGEGGSYNPGQEGSYNPGHGGSYNPGHGGSYNPGHGGSYNNGKGGSYNNGKGGSYNNGKGGWGQYE